MLPSTGIKSRIQSLIWLIVVLVGTLFASYSLSRVGGSTSDRWYINGPIKKWALHSSLGESEVLVEPGEPSQVH